MARPERDRAAAGRGDPGQERGHGRKNLTSDDLAGDPTNLPIRAHEILEDALRDHLSGIDDQGGGAAYAETYADIQVTRAILGYLAPLIDARQPGLAGTLTAELDTLDQALLATERRRPGERRVESLGAAPPQRVSTSTPPSARAGDVRVRSGSP